MAQQQVLHIKSAAELQQLLESTTYVLVDFHAQWCGPCKTIAPVIESFATKHAISNILAFAKVDVDEVPDVAQKYGITAMPTFLFFKETKQVSVNDEPLIRGANLRALNAAVEKLAGLAQAAKKRSDESASTA